MSKRSLYLAAYDVADPRRLVQALKTVRAYLTGGQKSVHELLLSPLERRELLADMRALLEPAEDRFFLLRLDAQARTYALGRARRPANPQLFYVG
jgi:CRISPR-associated protein Cas2